MNAVLTLLYLLLCVGIVIFVPPLVAPFVNDYGIFTGFDAAKAVDLQIDEAGDNKSIACIYYRRACKSGGGLSISGSDSFDEAFISEVDAAGENGRRICAAHGNDAAGDYKRHRCLRVILYFRVESVRTE